MGYVALLDLAYFIFILFLFNKKKTNKQKGRKKEKERKKGRLREGKGKIERRKKILFFDKFIHNISTRRCFLRAGRDKSRSWRGAANSLCTLMSLNDKLFWPRTVRKRGIWNFE